MITKDCPLCLKEVYSRTGDGCRMCGMPLEEECLEFCSEVCRAKYVEINNL